MKYTINELREMTPIDYELANKIDSIENEIDSLKEKKNQVARKYDNAIGNLDFEAASEERNKMYSIDEYIRRREDYMLELSSEYERQLGKYDRDDIKESWNEYISKENETFKKKHDKFLALRKELAALYLELAELQRKATIDACQVNRLYSTIKPQNFLWCVDSDLTFPETLEHYQSSYINRSHQLVRLNNDDFINALVKCGEIPVEKKNNLVAVVVHGLPVREEI